MKAWRLFLFLPIMLIGIIIFIALVKSKAAPQQQAPQEKTAVVRVMEVAPQDVVPRTLGYGQIQPGAVWDAVAQVAGKIIYLHPELKKGALLEAGTELLKIDPTDYALAIAKAEADLQGLAAQRAELDAKQSNTQSALKIEQEALVLAQRELKRVKDLGTASSRSAVEQQERQVLAQRQSIQSLQSTLTLLPAQRKLLDANQAVAEVQLQTARHNLARCAISLPIDARITAVNVEAMQFAQQGKVLVSADGIAVAEVNAQIPLEQARPLLPDNFVIQAGSTLSEILAQFDIQATVRLQQSGFDAEWPARLARVSESEDPQTRSRGFIVAVDKPYQQVEVGKKPPLIRNTFVEVELRGKPKSNLFAIPRSALHDGDTVYLADANKRLEIRLVKVAFTQGDIALISAGLQADERLILSDVIPASSGMLLALQRDDATAMAVKQAALGEAKLR
jgi:multidrug efflux pump subunit AcrA (membrane-fusion protein)